MYIMFNKVVSIIRLTSSIGGKPHPFILISYVHYYTTFMYKKQAVIIAHTNSRNRRQNCYARQQILYDCRQYGVLV